MEARRCHIIALVGISGSGKTTLARILAERLGYQYIELDHWFKRDKPVFPLSNGQSVKNWDRFDVIDWAGFEYQVKQACKTHPGVVIAGFALTADSIPGGADHTILLRTGHTADDIIKRAADARKVSKRYEGPAAERDKLYVRERVYPFYQEVLKKLAPHTTLDVFDEKGQRIPIEKLIDEILTIISPTKHTLQKF